MSVGVSERVRCILRKEVWVRPRKGGEGGDKVCSCMREEVGVYEKRVYLSRFA